MAMESQTKNYLVVKRNNEKTVINAVKVTTPGSSIFSQAEFIKFWNENDELVAMFKIADVKEFYTI